MLNVTCLWDYSRGFSGTLLNLLFHFLLSCGEIGLCSWSFVPGYGMVNRLVMWCAFVQTSCLPESRFGAEFILWYQISRELQLKSIRISWSSPSGCVERMFLFLQPVVETRRHGLHVAALMMERLFSLALFSLLVVVCFSGDESNTSADN